jgi:putative radical SAM enzyme (TIGR03279 family)
MVRIADIVPESIAEELDLEIGSRIVRINGETVRDGIDFRFLEAEPRLEVELATEAGERFLFEIDKDAAEPLGIIPAPDPVRQCANKCVFCFIDGNPEGARQSLHLKDDDFRLSFTYGSYVTLTNLGPRGLQRLIEQRLSPLYVSVHATEPDVRRRLLGVERGGEIVEELRQLIAGGLELHTQVVLCPDWNDGAHLDRTIEDLYALGPAVLSLSVVPVGLTKYNLGRPVRLLEPAQAAYAIDRVDLARKRARAERGSGWAYAGDELYFIADRPIPGAHYYDEWPLIENGVGAVRSLLAAFEDGLHSVGSFAGRRVVVVTGTRMAPVLRPLATRLAEQSGALVDVVAIENRYFGPTVNTAGLLPGHDILSALHAAGPCDLILLPAEALNDDACFIDDLALEELVRAVAPAEVRAASELTAALAST